MDSNRIIDLSVGFLMIIGIFCLSYVSITFGKVNLFGTNQYQVTADFSNVTGLNQNTEVEMLGIRIGTVEEIKLLDSYKARVNLSIDRQYDLPPGTVASIKTRGLLGEKYVSISPGGLPGPPIKKDGSGKISETNAPLILEDLIGKMVFGESGA